MRDDESINKIMRGFLINCRLSLVHGLLTKGSTYFGSLALPVQHLPFPKMAFLFLPGSRRSFVFRAQVISSMRPSWNASISQQSVGAGEFTSC